MDRRRSRFMETRLRLESNLNFIQFLPAFWFAHKIDWNAIEREKRRKKKNFSLVARLEILIEFNFPSIDSFQAGLEETSPK